MPHMKCRADRIIPHQDSGKHILIIVLVFCLKSIPIIIGGG